MYLWAFWAGQTTVIVSSFVCLGTAGQNKLFLKTSKNPNSN